MSTALQDFSDFVTEMLNLFLSSMPRLRVAVRPALPRMAAGASARAVAAAQHADALADSAERLRRQRVMALRDWLGEDHELVRDLPQPAAAPR